MRFFKKIKAMMRPQEVNYAEVLAQGGVIVDVRSQEEYSLGHAKGSLNIPLHLLANKVEALRAKEVILVCRSGARAGQAKTMLEQKGVVAYNAGPWQNLQKP